MNVGQLKQLLLRVTNDTEVVIHGQDHSYNKASAMLSNIARSGNYMYEYYGQQHLEAGSIVTKAIVIFQ